MAVTFELCMQFKFSYRFRTYNTINTNQICCMTKALNSNGSGESRIMRNGTDRQTNIATSRLNCLGAVQWKSHVSRVMFQVSTVMILLSCITCHHHILFCTLNTLYNENIILDSLHSTQYAEHDPLHIVSVSGCHMWIQQVSCSGHSND